jgi:hypothetical protein
MRHRAVSYPTSQIPQLTSIPTLGTSGQLMEGEEHEPMRAFHRIIAERKKWLIAIFLGLP